MNATNGSLIWNYTMKDATVSSPLVYNGIVYFGDESGYIYALRADNGTLLWMNYSGGAIESAPAISNGILYLSNVYNKAVYALNSSTGEILGVSNPLGERVWSSPSISEGLVYVGSSNGRVYALNATPNISSSELITKWNYSAGGDVNSSPAVYDGIVYFGSGDKNIYALNATNGGLIWKSPTGSPVGSSPAISSGLLWGTNGRSSDGVYAINLTHGNILWAYYADVPFSSSVAISNGMIYAANDNLYAFGERKLDFSYKTTHGNATQNWIYANLTTNTMNGVDNLTIFLYNTTSVVRKNFSTDSPFFVNFTSLPYGNYYLNATANNSHEPNSAFSQTVSISLYPSSPVVTVSSVSTTAGSLEVSFNSTEQGTALEECFFKVYNSSGSLVRNLSNVLFNCTSGIENKNTFNVSETGNYSLVVYAKNKFGKEGNKSINFLVSPVAPQSSGSTSGSTGTSGGGGAVYCNTTWTCTSWSSCINGTQTRTCSYPLGSCIPISGMPSESENCTPPNLSASSVTPTVAKSDSANFTNTSSSGAPVTGYVTFGNLSINRNYLIYGVVGIIVIILAFSFPRIKRRFKKGSKK